MASLISIEVGMLYLEMSRDLGHGGGAWAFTNCIWAPTRTTDGRRWPFWESILDVRPGDVVLHLRGASPDAYFVGYSRASSAGLTTIQRPPHPGEWAYSQAFFRADLEDFIPFHRRVNLLDIFNAKRNELEEYFEANKLKHSDKRKLFFVRQSNTLRCLNGAYFSEVDDELIGYLFDPSSQVSSSLSEGGPVSVETASQVAMMRTRIGQKAFSDRTKANYDNACCFPGCNVSDPRFLVGSHIARWSDNEQLRGHLGNGLCFCLIHDKAFELGLFTLDADLRILPNPKKKTASFSAVFDLSDCAGQTIKVGKVLPLDDALLEHWIRVDIDPHI